MEKLTLEEQCLTLSISKECIFAIKTEEKGKWKFIDSKAKGLTVEDLVLKHFKKSDWDGVHDEGGSIKLILSILELDYESLFSQPFRGYLKDEHDFFLKPQEHITNVCNYVSGLDNLQFEAILNRRFQYAIQLLRHGNKLREDNCLLLWHLLGNSFFAKWLDLDLSMLNGRPDYLAFPGIYGGMPDLLLWKNSDVKFIEVKAVNDKLHKSQIDWFATAMPKLNLDASIMHVLPHKGKV